MLRKNYLPEVIMLQGLMMRVITILTVVIMAVAQLASPAQAVQLNGNYTEDGRAVVSVLRTSLQDFDDPDAAQAAQTEAKLAIEEFTGRYHADRYKKMISFTTLRTVFNTLASNYRSSRPLKESRQERVLAQLDQVERALEVGR